MVNRHLSNWRCCAGGAFHSRAIVDARIQYRHLLENERGAAAGLGGILTDKRRDDEGLAVLVLHGVHAT